MTKRDAEYYNKLIATLRKVHESEKERTQHLESAVRLSKQEVDEFQRRHDTNEKERQKQHELVKSLEGDVQKREQEIGTLKRQIQCTRRDIQEKDVNIQTLRQQVKRVQMRARTAEEIKRLRSESTGDMERHSRQLALLNALKYINERIKDLEDSKLRSVHRDLDEQDEKTKRQRVANDALKKENEKTKVSIENEMEEQRQYIEDIAKRIKQTRDEIDRLEGEYQELENAPQEIAFSTEVLEGNIQQLKDQIAQTERDRSAIEEEKKSLVQRIMRSTEPEAKMRECMMLLKSAIINLWKDYQSIGQVRKNILKRPDQEAVFKEAHHTIKTALRLKVAPADKRWVSDVINSGKQPLTDADVPELVKKTRTGPAGGSDYRTRTIFKALQEMVIAWDVMPDEKKKVMTTCEEVTANAMVLYALARHALAEQNRVLKDKKAELDANDKRRPGAKRVASQRQAQSPSQSPQRGTASASPAANRKPPSARHFPTDPKVSPPRPPTFHADPASSFL